MSNYFFLGVLIAVVLFVLAYFARKKGTVKKRNVLIQLADNVLVRVRAFFTGVVEDTKDVVAAADIDIANANAELDKFEDEILNLREQVRLQKKQLPQAQTEVEKWESIYKATVKANDAQGQAESARRLKVADQRLESLTKLIEENTKVLTSLEDQKRSLKDALSNAEVLKDRLAAQKTSAELRQRAQNKGLQASNGLGILKELEEEVQRTEARAEAVEETNAEETALEDKYTVTNDKFNSRLEALRNQ